MDVEVDVSTEIVIARPRSDVAAFAADPDNIPKWYKNIRSVEWLTPRPLAIGTELAFGARFMWRRFEYRYGVVEFEPESRLVMRTGDEVIPDMMVMETTYEWERVDDGATRMILRNRGTVGRVPLGTDFIVKHVFQFGIGRANQADLARLKRVLEAS